jgi:hypothetical protein
MTHPVAVPPPASPRAPKQRDARVDFFRGAALLIIFVAHVPGSVLGPWIPAQFGLSDAAHMFVFISGYAAAIAFGGTFARMGFLIGTARIAWRCAQLHACHIGLFVVVATMCAALADPLGGIEYAARLNMGPFFAEPGHALIGLFGLTYVPTFFDILPLYMLVLAMVPLAMLLARVHKMLPILVSAALWLAVQLFGFGLHAGYDEDARWGFNPFAWQLLFFTGYALSSGWIERPALSRPVFLAAVAYLAASAAIMMPSLYGNIELLAALRGWLLAHSSKPDLDPLQYLHFLALAGVVLHLLDGRHAVLSGAWAKPLVRAGQQALVVFIAGMTLSHLGGMALQTYGTGAAAQLVVHAIGFGTLIGLAYASSFVKNAPWKTKAAPAPAPATGTARAPSAAPAGALVTSGG